MKTRSFLLFLVICAAACVRGSSTDTAEGPLPKEGSAPAISDPQWERLESMTDDPATREKLQFEFLESLYRKKDFQRFNVFAARFLSRPVTAAIRRQVLDWYLEAALAEGKSETVLKIADVLDSDEGYKDKTRLRKFRASAELNLAKVQPKRGGWWAPDDRQFAESYTGILKLKEKYPENADMFYLAALEVLYRSQQYRKFNELAEEALQDIKNPDERRTVLDWYLHCAYNEPNATRENFEKVAQIAEELEKDKGYKDEWRIHHFKAQAEIGLMASPAVGGSWFVDDPVLAASWQKVLELKKKYPDQGQFIEYRALMILHRTKQFAKFNELAEEFLPHFDQPWLRCDTLSAYLHSAFWGTRDYKKVLEVGKLLRAEPEFHDHGRTFNFEFDAISESEGLEAAWKYLLERLKASTNESEVIRALHLSYSRPWIFKGMSRKEVAALYRSKEKFISKTEQNVPVITRLRMAVVEWMEPKKQEGKTGKP